ncbi:magnesium transporter [candidate division KSB1 bacterium]|nr:magnesium transporter [candidate division KSB1 bacterium]
MIGNALDNIPEKEQNSCQEIILELLKSENDNSLKLAVEEMHPADIAEALSRLNDKDQKRIFSLLKPEISAEVLVELDSTVRYSIFEEMDEKWLVSVIGTLDSDDATDLIGELDEDIAKRVLSAMPWKEFREVETLLRHDEDTAGGIMALEIVAVGMDRTAQQALDALRRKSDEVEDVYNIYVIDTHGVLQGIVSLKDLVLAAPKAILSELMDKEPIVVREDQDQEEVAMLFSKYDLVAAPVINVKGQLVGRITVDDVLDVVEEEASQDIARMAGISSDDLQERSVFKLSSVRLPWLLIAFFGEMLSAKVLSHFMPDYGKVIMVTFFIPLIMAMGGNMGIQSSTVIIRGLALGDIHLKDTGRSLLRELTAAFINGLIIALLVWGVVTFWFHTPQFGFVLGLALISVLFIATLMGTLMPMLLKRMGVDPAVATGPFITTANDVGGLFIYFSILRGFGSAF